MMVSSDYDQPYLAVDDDIYVKYAWAPVKMGSTELDQICANRITTLTKELNAWRQLSMDNEGRLQRNMEHA